MPGIGSLIREIAYKIWESKHNFAQYNQYPGGKCYRLWFARLMMSNVTWYNVLHAWECMMDFKAWGLDIVIAFHIGFKAEIHVGCVLWSICSTFDKLDDWLIGYNLILQSNLADLGCLIWLFELVLLQPHLLIFENVKSLKGNTSLVTD